MGLLGRIFGSDEVISKGVQGIISGVDKAIYTEEEKKDNFKSFLKLYEPFKIAQRYLALIFGIPFASLHTLAFSARMVDWDNPALQASMKAIQADMNDSLGMIVLVIIGFYFAGGAAEGILKKMSK